MKTTDHSDDEAEQAGRPTLKTIAFMTGLGVTTVSRALKDAPEIGLETRKRVQLIAQQVGYRPNRAGVRLRTGKTNVISLVLDTTEPVGGFVSDIVYGVSEQIARTGYHLIITPYAHGHDPLEPIKYVIETGSADGVIISRTQPDDPRVRYMREHGLPFATHGRTGSREPHPFHDFDNGAFARLAVARLALLGRRRIALLEPPQGLTYLGHTRDGFVDAIAEHGLQEISYKTGVNIDTSIEQTKQATIELMSRPNRPDGFVCSSGGSAFAIVAGIEAMGLTLGRDVDVVSKQSFRLLQTFRPQIHVVDEDFRLAGRELARFVLGAIEGKPVAQLQKFVVPSTVTGPNDGIVATNHAEAG